jgi:galactosamine-6-phosphate isomerase
MIRRMKIDSPPGMQVHVVRNSELMSRWAASRIRTVSLAQPNALLGLATGSSPLRTYQLLAGMAVREPRLFRAIRILKLDEWGGLDLNDPANCESYLQRHVLKPWGVKANRYCGWHSRPKNPAAECARVARWLERHGPMDLCILGLGLNGHLLLNEPGAALTAAPHVARLSPESKRHTMLRQARRRPRYGLTIGLAGVLQSRRILLLVSGAKKARQLQRLVNGPLTTECPASFLQLHPNLTVVCDAAAAGGLK